MEGLWLTRAMRQFSLVMFVVLTALTIIGIGAILLQLFGGFPLLYTSDSVFVGAMASGILYQVCRMREAQDTRSA